MAAHFSNEKATMQHVKWAVVLGLAWAVLAGTPAVHAWYRGDEYQKRGFIFDSEYFVDRLSYQQPLEDRLAFLYATNAYIISAGSFTRRDLLALQELKLDKTIAEPFDFVFDFLTDQDFDDDYYHALAGFAWNIDPGLAVELIGEPQGKKEFADVGLGLNLQRDRNLLRGRFLVPNFAFNGKNDMGGSFQKRAYNLQGEALYEVTEPLDLYLAADLDFPSEVQYTDPEFNFQFQSYKPAAGLTWRLAPRQTLWTLARYENTRKVRASPALDATEDYSTRRTVWQWQTEYIHVFDRGRRGAVGLFYAYFDEPNDFENNLEQDIEYYHLSRMVYGTWREPVGGPFYVNLGLYLDAVEHKELHNKEPDQNGYNSGLEGKLALGIEWRRGPYQLQLGISQQVDSVAFGGGYGQALFIF